MKRITSTLRRCVALSMMLLLCLCIVGCGKKTYENLEAYEKDNPLPASLTNMTAQAGDTSVQTGLTISGNTLIIKSTMGQKVFGVDPRVDSMMQAQMDQYFMQDATKKQLDGYIDEIAEASGIAAYLIDARYEFYNPNETTPGYTYTYKYSYSNSSK